MLSSHTLKLRNKKKIFQQKKDRKIEDLENLTSGLQLPSEEQIGWDPKDNEDHDQSYNIGGKVGVDHIQFFQSCEWWFEMAVDLETPELFTSISICGKSSSFESVSDVW